MRLWPSCIFHVNGRHIHREQTNEQLDNKHATTESREKQKQQHQEKKPITAGNHQHTARKPYKGTRNSEAGEERGRRAESESRLETPGWANDKSVAFYRRERKCET